jgi:ribosomal protein L18
MNIAETNDKNNGEKQIKIGRAILELDISKKDIKSADNPWDAHRDSVVRMYNNTEKSYKTRLQKIADKCKENNVNTIVFPACTFVYKEESRISDYLNLFSNTEWIISGMLNSLTKEEKVAVWHNNEPVVSHSFDIPIAFKYINGFALAAISSTIKSAKDPSKVFNYQNGAAVSFIFDLGHHQYGGRYMMTLKSVRKKYLNSSNQPVVLLSFWRPQMGTVKSPWVIPTDNIEYYPDNHREDKKGDYRDIIERK